MSNYILSRSEEWLQYAKLMEGMLVHLSSKKFSENPESKKNIEIPRMGILSNMIPGITFTLFNNKDLIESLPNGFVTENIIGIPLEKFKKFSEEINQKSDKMNCEYDLAKFFFSYMKPLVENNFNFTFDKSSEDEVMKAYEKKQLNLDSYLLENNPDVISNRELSKLIEGKNFEMLEVLLHQSKNFNPQKLLRISTEGNNELNELGLLTSSLNEGDKKISIEMFRQKCSSQLNGVDNLRFVLQEMNNLIKDSDNNPYIFLKNSDEFIKYAVLLTPLQFKAVASDLMEKVVKKVALGEKTKFKTELGLKITSNPDCNLEMRDILIDELSGMSNLQLYHNVKRKLKF